MPIPSFPILSVLWLAWCLLGTAATAQETRLQGNGVVVVTLGARKSINDMAVYPQGGIPNRPLLVVAHGSGGSGPKEINGWLELAKKNNFTVVCPTFLSAVHSMHIPADAPYFNGCLKWIETNLGYDKQHVYMTGFSGGGYAVWYLGTKHADFFAGLFLQSGNFAGPYYDLNLSAWHDKPIHVIWGSEDSPTVISQNKQAVDLLPRNVFPQFSCEIIPDARHVPHHDLVAAWIFRLSSH